MTVTMQQHVLMELRESITSGALPPGSQLVQEELAQRLEVSRVPVREALRSLAAEGLVEYFPNRGFFVTQLSVDDLAEVYRLRHLIEREVLMEAARRVTQDDVRDIEGLASAVEEAGSPVRVAEANKRFHFAIFELSGMPRAVRLLEQLWDATDAYRAVYFGLPDSHEHITREHKDLCRALAAGDGRRLVAVQDSHRQRSELAVSQALLPSVR